MISRATDLLLSLAFPQSCHVCRGEVNSARCGIACTVCWELTRFFNPDDALCAKCGLPFETIKLNTDAQCRQCDEFSFDRAVACGEYAKALSAAILNLKKVPVIPANLTEQIVHSIKRAKFEKIDLIIPVPLSSKRRIERGYNQAEMIARIVSKVVGVPLDAHTLVRNTHTPVHRAGMDKRARESTVKNAFGVVRPKLVQGRSILLIDDILTSGATASTCARVLKKSGSAEVNLLTLARAVAPL